MKLIIKHAMLSYTGDIADDAGNPLNGEYLMTFSLYDDSQGYIIWEEMQKERLPALIGNNTTPIEFTLI